MKKFLPWIIGIVGILVALLIVVSFFERIPIEGTTLAMDWKGLWIGLREGLQYGNATGLRIPPWSALLVWPLGQLSFAAGWGVLAFATMAALVLSAPRGSSRGIFLFGVLALVFSYPALRTIADGNFEVLVIAGCLIAFYGVSKENVLALMIGILLITSKVQQTWLLILVLPLILWRNVRPEKLRIVAAGLALVCIPALLWKGREWIEAVFAIQERGSQMDSSWWATASRLGIPMMFAGSIGILLAAASVAVIVKFPGRFSRGQIGLMIAASLILSPYMAGNNFLTLYAVAAIPLLQASLPAGLIVIGLANLPFFFLGNRDIQYAWSATYWTAVVLIVWILLIVTIVRARNPFSVRPSSSPDAASVPDDLPGNAAV